MKNTINSIHESKTELSNNSLVKKTTVLVGILVFSIILSSCSKTQSMKATLGLSYIDTSFRYINPSKPAHGATNCIRCHVPSPWH